MASTTATSPERVPVQRSRTAYAVSLRWTPSALCSSTATVNSFCYSWLTLRSRLSVLPAAYGRQDVMGRHLVLGVLR